MNEFEEISAEDEEYFLKHGPYHLAEASMASELNQVLTEYYFLNEKVFKLGPQPLIEDYDLALQAQTNLGDDTKGSLRLIQDAIRLSADVLTQDNTQLAGQLLARLMSLQAAEIQKLLERIKAFRERPWLRPLVPSLLSPGRLLLLNIQLSSDPRDLTITPDGYQVILAMNDQSLRIYDLKTGTLMRVLRGHTGSVSAIAMSRNSRLGISGSSDNTIKIWDLETGQEQKTLYGHTRGINAVAITSDGKMGLSGGGDSIVKVWDFKNGVEKQVLQAHSSSITSVIFTPDGQQAISGSEDRKIKVWDLRTGNPVWSIQVEGKFVQKLAVTPDGRYLLVAAYASENDLSVWDLTSRKKLYTVTGHGPYLGIEALAITPNSQQFISGGSDSKIKIWDLVSATLLHTLDDHRGKITGLAVSPDGNLLVSASVDRTLKQWNLKLAENKTSATEHGTSVTALAITPDGQCVISGEADGKIKVWSLLSCSEIQTLQIHSGRITALAVLPNGQQFLSSSEDETLRLWNLENLEEPLLLKKGIQIIALAALPDGKKVLYITASKNTSNLRDELSSLREVSKTPSTSLVEILTILANERVRLLDLKNGIEECLQAKLLSYPYPNSYLQNWMGMILLNSKRVFTPITVIQNGCLALSGHPSSGITIWDLRKGEEICTIWDFARQEELLNSLIVPGLLETENGNDPVIMEMQDGRLAFFNHTDCNIETLNLQNGFKEILVQLPREPIRTIKFFSQENYAVSCDGSTLKCWDIKKGNAIASFHGQSTITNFMIAPDQITIVAGELSGQMHFLRLEGL